MGVKELTDKDKKVIAQAKITSSTPHIIASAIIFFLLGITYLIYYLNRRIFRAIDAIALYSLFNIVAIKFCDRFWLKIIDKLTQ